MRPSDLKVPLVRMLFGDEGFRLVDCGLSIGLRPVGFRASVKDRLRQRPAACTESLQRVGHTEVL